MRRSWLVLGLAIVAGALAVTWSGAARRRGALSVPEGVTATGVGWLGKPLLAAGDWAGDVGRSMFRRGGTIAENETLREQVALLKNQNQRLLSLRRENDELRALLKMPPAQSGRFIVAEIVAMNVTDATRTAVVNAGTQHGVRAKDAVFAPQGVVGQVVRVSPLSSTVLLVTDRLSGIGAMSGRTGARGTLLGTGDRICKLAYLDYQADVREGDAILTSGDSKIYPRGYVLGRVLKVERDKAYSSLTAFVDPTVPFDQLGAVTVRIEAGP